MTKKTWITAFAFGLPWTIIMIVYSSIVNGALSTAFVVANLVAGTIGGLLFAIAMQLAAKRLSNSINIETTSDEKIIKEAGANHFKGKEGVGGKLVLTNKRLIFKSHKLNIQNHQESFDLGQIVNVESTKTLRLLNNGLTLELRGSNKQKFIVDEPKAWVDTITSQKASASQ